MGKGAGGSRNDNVHCARRTGASRKRHLAVHSTGRCIPGGCIAVETSLWFVHVTHPSPVCSAVQCDADSARLYIASTGLHAVQRSIIMLALFLSRQHTWTPPAPATCSFAPAVNAAIPHDSSIRRILSIWRPSIAAVAFPRPHRPIAPVEAT